MSKDFMNIFLNDIKENVNGFLAVAVTEVESGLSYGSLSLDKNFDPELASAFNLEVVKAKLKAIKGLGLDEKIHDIMITLTNQIHIIDMSPNYKFYIYLAVNSSTANLAMTRSVLRKYKVNLEDNLG